MFEQKITDKGLLNQNKQYFNIYQLCKCHDKDSSSNLDYYYAQWSIFPKRPHQNLHFIKQTIDKVEHQLSMKPLKNRDVIASKVKEKIANLIYRLAIFKNRVTRIPGWP